MDAAAVTSPVATAVANPRAEAALIAIRLAAESQRQMADLLARRVAPSGNPAHLGGQVDTYA